MQFESRSVTADPLKVFFTSLRGAEDLQTWQSGGLGQCARRRVGDTASVCKTCLLYTSDAADESPGVDLGGRRIIKKKFF